MTLFSKSFPLSIASRIWDCYVFEGEAILYRSAIGVLSFFSHRLLKMDFEDMARFLSNIDFSNVDEGKLFEAIFSVDVPIYIRSLIQRINAQTS